MYFKKLELLGFKSFGDKTTIQFEPGVTAIVGPNGCGKSNISDAIRWVLGEQSAKSLRGSSMEDIIFSGSQNKEPLNFAEVALTLSNEDRIFPMDYEEITIARRLYRSGESEYLLNKNAVRLRDIHELLMGTGIGTESYSIIEQGKMDAVLNSKPEDRRMIFEEAAGITKFKSKKKEALRKLEQTDANLLRVNDIIQEVKRQISSIERQAKKAESYKTEFEKMKKLELSVASREFFIFDRQRKEKEEGLDSLKAQESDCLGAVEEMEKKCVSERASLEVLEESHRQADAEEMRTSSEIRRHQDRILLNRERMGELVERRENLLRQAESVERRLQEFADEYEKLNNEFESAHREESEGAAFLGSVEAEYAVIENGLRDQEAASTGVRQRMNEITQEKMRLDRDGARIEAEAAGLSNRLKRLKQEEETLLFEVRETEEKSGAPLFELKDAERPASFTLEGRVRGFKEKVISIFRSLFQKQVSELGPEEESLLDSEIKSFSEDISRIRGAEVSQESLLRHSDDTKRRLEEKLARIAEELQSLKLEEEGIDGRITTLTQNAEMLSAQEAPLQQELAGFSEMLREKLAEKDKFLVRLAETRSKQGQFTARREKIEKDKNWILSSRKSQEELLDSSRKEAEESIARKNTLEAENAQLETSASQLGAQRDEVLRLVENVRRERNEAAARLESVEKERRAKEEFLIDARERLHAFQMERVQLGFEMDRLKERIFNAYQVDLAVQEAIVETEAAAGAEMGTSVELNLEEAKAEIQKQREKLNRLGPVNLVAIEEHAEMKQRFEFLTQQEQDLVKAKEDIHKAILKINRTTRELFSETFAKIQKNFTEYYKLLFGGGSAELVLLDENDVLESGIEIVARPPGKKLQNISLLSGGEKALTAVALLFALFKVKPSPFCVLDEIDAPLDESNVDRFCGVLKDFITGSQFILITHNKRTMNLADAMYGITMAQTGISKVVSVRFSENPSRNGNGSGHKEQALVL